ncbi:MAG: phosphoribosylaminoimidazolesuccinocarboxamide synthase [Bacteroidia bacterium]|nr:phosphoribosylaminoimidazolesuccinocarboxamide synthase [Bacteroidia bacterium]
MKSGIPSTHLQFFHDFTRYQGKVRDVYNLKDTVLVMVATDRISAFDVILPNTIPFKGQVLNQLAAYFLEATESIMPNHLLLVPDPNVSLCLACKPLPVEFVVRGYLCGHAWREYQAGKRVICGATLPDGLVENQQLPEPILTPTTKSAIGHDLDISPDEIIRSGLLDAETWHQASHFALLLFAKGQEMAQERGLLLADTKYEFGIFEEELHLIDEIHTPDSSRYFVAENYSLNFPEGRPVGQLSKEFVREWLMQQGFMGKDGQTPPVMPDAFVEEVSSRYIQLYETMTGRKFQKADYAEVESRIQQNVNEGLKKLGVYSA